MGVKELRESESTIERELWDKNRQSVVSKRIEIYGRKIEKRGMYQKQKECMGGKELRDRAYVANLISKKKLKSSLWRKVCSSVLETRVKYKNIKKVCDYVFGNWEYMTNGEDNNKGCRIMVGWNSNVIQAWLIAQSRQFMFFMMETIDRKSKFFCTMIYASNSGMERRKL
ncbi:hypothetical protein Tco_1405210 [Tanacetum coccineum]